MHAKFNIYAFILIIINILLYENVNYFFFQNGGHRGSVGGYSGNIGHNQSNHIPAAPPPPRKGDYF